MNPKNWSFQRSKFSSNLEKMQKDKRDRFMISKMS